MGLKALWCSVPVYGVGIRASGLGVYALTTRTSLARFMVRGRRETGNDSPQQEPKTRTKPLKEPILGVLGFGV